MRRRGHPTTTPDWRAAMRCVYTGVSIADRHTGGANMVRQLLVGGAACLCNIVIHALVMTVVVRVARAFSHKPMTSPSLFLTSVMAATVSVLMAAHSVEIAVWSLVYWIVGAGPAGADLLYFAFVNYTTLGYGDVVPVEAWRLLGPIAAMNGILLFGWSTAVIYDVLRRTMEIEAAATAAD
jgi:ion channel